jgi:hypothetical protein
MKLVTIVFASLGLAGGLAAAQPTEPGSGTTDVTPQPPPEPQPPPPQPQPPPPPPPQPRVVSDPVAHDDGIRPSELAFAIGIGYGRLPGSSMDLQTPNVASARLRLISGVTFEPTVTIANSSHDTNTGGAAMDMSEATTDLQIGTLVRFPVIRHHHVDFEVLGSVGFGVSKLNPDGDYNTRTTTSFGLGWGIGIGYWLSPHWQLSTSATNPLLSYSSTKQEFGPDADQAMKESFTTFAVEFNPTVTVMIHLYN